MIFWICRFWIRTWRKRVRCSLNSVPNSTRKTWPKSWFRTSRCACSICKWRMPFWRTTFTVRPKRRFCWLPTLCRPSTAIMTRIFTPPATWPTIAFCHSGNYSPRHCIILIASSFYFIIIFFLFFFLLFFNFF